MKYRHAQLEWKLNGPYGLTNVEFQELALLRADYLAKQIK